MTWIVNCWSFVEPRLTELSVKANPKHDVLLFDLRVERGGDVRALDPNQVMPKAQVLELTAIRQVLNSHPYLFQRGWCKEFSVAAKEAVKKAGGKLGCYCLVAYGDSAASDDGLPMNFSVMPCFHHDLREIAKHNLGEHPAPA